MSGFATAKFRSGERLFGAGEPAEKLYVIQGGRVSLHDAVTDQTFAELGPGEFIGEHALLDCSVRSVTAVAEGEVVCLEMPSAAMRQLLSKESATVTTLLEAALLQMHMHNQIGVQRNRSGSQSPTDTDTDPGRDAGTPAFEIAKTSGFARLQFKNADPLFRVGEVADKLYLVQEGRVSLHDARTGAAFAVLGPGEFLGEHALLDSSRRSVTAVADGDVVCLAMDCEDARHLLANEPAGITTLLEAILLQMHMHNAMRREG